MRQVSSYEDEIAGTASNKQSPLPSAEKCPVEDENPPEKLPTHSGGCKPTKKDCSDLGIAGITKAAELSELQAERRTRWRVFASNGA
jgi:hypothetical protein